ncbi:AGR124Cp [Eremothecium gossypii ATCC 10895]|uniref:AGR124Cp n=1 Tax=Eremothecium gossypii (strain ATCC 10895 / CBS 109.51 / FGSC 9923 / NRRL Y-1056) TaxID=284811 RepID=Q74ZS4_EREGS|nr:AGR124Cp [Eremothecium gossypii ATCC 10895]AAS54614.1 AGR124Cp [Eremothecium gossypii ATCC 10895]
MQLGRSHDGGGLTRVVFGLPGCAWPHDGLLEELNLLPWCKGVCDSAPACKLCLRGRVDCCVRGCNCGDSALQARDGWCGAQTCSVCLRQLFRGLRRRRCRHMIDSVSISAWWSASRWPGCTCACPGPAGSLAVPVGRACRAGAVLPLFIGRDPLSMHVRALVARERCCHSLPLFLCCTVPSSCRERGAKVHRTARAVQLFLRSNPESHSMPLQLVRHALPHRSPQAASGDCPYPRFVSSWKARRYRLPPCVFHSHGRPAFNPHRLCIACCCTPSPSCSPQCVGSISVRLIIACQPQPVASPSHRCPSRP